MSTEPEISLDSDWPSILHYAGRILRPIGHLITDKQAQAHHAAAVLQIVLVKRLAESIGNLDDHLQQASQMMASAADSAERAEASRHAATLKHSASLTKATWALFIATLAMAAATVVLVVRST